MALVLTLLKDGNDVWGGRCKVQHANIALDDDYPTGGYPLPASKFFGPGATLWNLIVGDFGVAAGGAFRFYYDYVNSKLMVFVAAGSTPSGTIEATFTGDELAGHTHVFTGDALAAHSHTIPVTAGTAGDAVTNNAGVLESTGGQDLTSNTTSGGTPAGTNASTSGGTPAGTVEATFTGAAGGGGAFAQAAASADLSTVTALRVTALGR